MIIVAANYGVLKNLMSAAKRIGFRTS